MCTNPLQQPASNNKDLIIQELAKQNTFLTQEVEKWKTNYEELFKHIYEGIM